MIILENIERRILDELSQVKLLLKGRCLHSPRWLKVKRFHGLSDLEIICSNCSLMLKRISWMSVPQGKPLTDKQAINYYRESG